MRSLAFADIGRKTEAKTHKNKVCLHFIEKSLLNTHEIKQGLTEMIILRDSALDGYTVLQVSL